MILEEKKIILKNGTEAILKTPEIEDAEMMLENIKICSGETDFLSMYPDDWAEKTVESEAKWIKHHREDDNALLIACFIDGEAVGSPAKVALAELEKGKSRKATAQNWQQCHEIFRSYPMSIVLTSNTEIDDVVEIFERINQGGKHLTVFDLIHATTWSEKFDLKQNIDDFNTPQRIKQFGRLSEKVFSLSLTLNAFDDARSLYQLKLTPEICTKIWPRTKSALLATLDFLKQMRLSGDLAIYHNLIPTLQYYFFASESKEIDPRHQKTLEKWFWDAKFSKRYSTSAATHLKEDVKWILSLINEEI